MKDKTRILVVGAGYMGERHVKKGYGTLRENGLDGFELAGVCDLDKDRADSLGRLAREAGFAPAVFTDLAEAIRALQPDAVDLILPHGLHHTCAAQCLEAGCHVLIEKPFGITMKAAREIIAKAEETGKVAAMAENCRRYPLQRAARWAMMEAGLLGEMKMFAVTAFNKWAQDPTKPMFRWRLLKKKSGGFFVVDSGAHTGDSLRYFFGTARTVSARVGTRSPHTIPDTDGNEIRTDTEDCWSAHIEFENGVFGSWTGNMQWKSPQGSMASFTGAKGTLWTTDAFHFFKSGKGALELDDGRTIELNELEKMYLDTLNTEQKEELFPGGVRDDVAIECYDFIRAIREQRPAELEGKEILKSKALNTAIYESSEAGTPVAVQAVYDGTIETYQAPINEHWGL